MTSDSVGTTCGVARLRNTPITMRIGYFTCIFVAAGFVYSTLSVLLDYAQGDPVEHIQGHLRSMILLGVLCLLLYKSIKDMVYVLKHTDMIYFALEESKQASEEFINQREEERKKKDDEDL